MITELLTINTANGNELNGKTVEVSYDEITLNEDEIQEVRMDALAELEEGNEDHYHYWQQHGCMYSVKTLR